MPRVQLSLAPNLDQLPQFIPALERHGYQVLRSFIAVVRWFDDISQYSSQRACLDFGAVRRFGSILLLLAKLLENPSLSILDRGSFSPCCIKSSSCLIIYRSIAFGV